MDAAATIRTARAGNSMSLRALAAAAHTSHSTISAYETGTKTPSTATLERIVRAAGYTLERTLHRRIDGGDLCRGDELKAVLELAGEFPARHARTLEAPVFGR